MEHIKILDIVGQFNDGIILIVSFPRLEGHYENAIWISEKLIKLQSDPDLPEEMAYNIENMILDWGKAHREEILQNLGKVPELEGDFQFD